MKILIVRSHYLGDTLLTMPVIRQLKELYPNSHITLLTKPGIHQDLLLNFQYLDEIIPLNGFWNTIKRLKEKKFDRVYLFKRSFSAALISCLASIPERIGFNTDNRKLLLTQSQPYNLNIHEVESMLSLLEYKTIDSTVINNSKQQYYFCSTTEKIHALNIINKLPPNKKNIVIHPLASNSLKNWDLEHWIELINSLQTTNQYNIILSGDTSTTTQKYHQAIKNKLSQNISIIDLSKKEYSLRENIALYEQCDLMIAVDSGPMHLASAVQTPVIGLFGPSSINRWQPWAHSPYITLTYNIQCQPCHLKITCNNTLECIKKITPAEVIESISEVLPLD